MAKVAFLGTGLLGSGMIERMLRGGDAVAAWNRTAARARPLEAKGARLAPTPADAVRGAERVHLCLSDDAAVDGLLGELLPALGAGAVVVDHTTVTPKGAAARARRCAERGTRFLHAPVFMGPTAARDGQGLMLCSGPHELFTRVEPALRAMTGDLWYLGERPDLAAAYKLFGNVLILAIVGGLADVFQLAKQVGVHAEDAHALFSRFKPAMTVELRGRNMAVGNFAPSFEMVMARKDLRLMLETAGGAPLCLVPALAARLDEAIAEGHGAEDVGAIAAGRRLA